ncbi:MAG: ATP-binding cassette domain-containing protein [Geminicoccaceae bacterium]
MPSTRRSACATISASRSCATASPGPRSSGRSRRSPSCSRSCRPRHYPPTISAGQQQRTSLARALIRKADVFLLDEPMSQLEPQLRAVLRARIKDWLITRKMTTVFVTHDQTEAIALADRIAVMEQGVLQQFLRLARRAEGRPANLFVASFIGEPPPDLFAARVDRSRPNSASPSSARPAAGPSSCISRPRSPVSPTAPASISACARLPAPR